MRNDDLEARMRARERETFEKAGHDPVADVAVTAARRRVRVERGLPVRDAYRAFVRGLLAG